MKILWSQSVSLRVGLTRAADKSCLSPLSLSLLAETAFDLFILEDVANNLPGKEMTVDCS